MAAGGAVAAAGRLVPGSTGSADPVLVGTGVNLVVLIASFAFGKRPFRNRGRRLTAGGSQTR
jgi:hypothetical protein